MSRPVVCLDSRKKRVRSKVWDVTKLGETIFNMHAGYIIFSWYNAFKLHSQAYFVFFLLTFSYCYILVCNCIDAIMRNASRVVGDTSYDEISIRIFPSLFREKKCRGVSPLNNDFMNCPNIWSFISRSFRRTNGCFFFSFFIFFIERV